MLLMTSVGINGAHAQDIAPSSPVVPTGDAAVSGMPLLRTAMPIPVQSEPLAAFLDRSKGQIWHRSTMLLAGSLCPACLIELEGHLRELPGIAYVKVARQAAPQNLAGAQPAEAVARENMSEPLDNSKEKPRAAAAVIIYDSHVVKFDGLMSLIKGEKYKARDIQDVEFVAK